MQNMETSYHIPVLFKESLDALVQNPNGTYIDLTFGGGGHSRGILERLGPKGHLIAFDKDTDAHENSLNDPRFSLVKHNFRYLKQYLKYLNIAAVDGILGDLGISSHQINTDKRGFAHRFNGPLDMRMDPESSLNAAQILDTYSEKELLRVFNEYGEIKNAYRLVHHILPQQNMGRFVTVESFKKAIDSLIPQKDPSKYLSQVFQALRIEVNQEMTDLQTLLEDSHTLIKAEGRLVVISYHSLEDRMVKNLLLKGQLQGTTNSDIFGRVSLPFKADPHKAIVPSEAEIAENPRSRSAKMRVGIKN
jgi:16S rRNA (cytosine1402-N4)-methyltransferase